MSDYKRLTEVKEINKFCSTVVCRENCEDCYAGKLYDRLAELEDKIVGGTLIEQNLKSYSKATMTDKIIDFEANLPHEVSEVICIKCLHRYMCVKPVETWLKDLQCPKCGSKGYVIRTGQELEEKGYER